jgi:hypothetical protein
MPDELGVYSYNADLNSLNNYGPVVHNIFIWGINKDDGTSDDIVTQADALELVATLNIEYNRFNLFFKYRGFDYINETDIYIPQSSGAIHSYVNQNEEFEQQDAINFYIPYEFGSGAAGYGGGRRAFASKQYLIPYTIIHEIGHVYNLRHIFSGEGGSNCEHVTRDPLDLDDLNDPNDTYFNANVAGDYVVDTAACPQMRGSATVGEDCDYVALGEDCQGTLFQINDEAKNYMGYNEIRCVDHLTIGQGIRMREKINTGYFNFAENTILSLYEPYQGEYYFAGPLNNDTDYKPLFQPGFDYWFIECNGPYSQPSEYNASFYYNPLNKISHYTKYEQNYGSITHPNHTAIKIKQVETSLGYTNIQKCYNNFNLSPNGGSIIKFNDAVFNTNVTITPQDSISINEQNLIQELSSGLYKIEKNYEDGSKQETIIFKDNN